MDYHDRNQLISLAEAAELLSMSRSTMYKYVESSKIPCLKIGGRIRFAVTDLEAWIDAHCSDQPGRVLKSSLGECDDV